ncbi:hypothetical protein GOODEAATRI_021866, partial [Goodea atripinnis]
AIRELATKALHNLTPQAPDYMATTDVLISQYLDGLKSSQVLTRCGSARALGCLPGFMVHSKLKQIFEGLQHMCAVSQKEGNFTEARRDAVRSVAQVFMKAGVCPHGCPDSVLCSENIAEVYGVLLSSLNDYTTDSRGDVGAWVKSVMCCLAQQAAEKIDHYRAHAGNIFLHLLHSAEPVVPHIPHKEELLSIFPVETITSLNWNAPSQAFKYIAQLLGLPEYQYHTLLGLSVSVGGITESTVHHSSQSLFVFLKEIQNDSDAVTQFAQTMLRIFRDNLHNDRFCGLIQFQGDVRKKVLSQLLLLLCHPFPVVSSQSRGSRLHLTDVYRPPAPTGLSSPRSHASNFSTLKMIGKPDLLFLCWRRCQRLKESDSRSFRGRLQNRGCCVTIGLGFLIRVWLASFLDVSQNELIYDTASTCLVVGVPFLLDLLTPTRAGSEDGGSVTLFSEAPLWADHWQLAFPSAPAKQHGLGPPLFPTERPSLFWTQASAERQGVGG